MANKLNGFLDNLVSGALSPKGNLGDFAHAARLYVDDAHRLSPKHKFLYHVSFNLNPEAVKIIPQLKTQEINMLVKSVDLPKYQISTTLKHQYNKKKCNLFVHAIRIDSRYLFRLYQCCNLPVQRVPFV